MPPQKQTMETLTKTFSEVLANLAFLFTDVQEAEADSDDQWLETTIGYNGPQEGMLRLLCTRTFSIHLAENLLGTDREDPDLTTKADDAVKELMNIVCGQFITAAHGTSEVFNLTIPRIRLLPDGPPVGENRDAGVSTFTVEGQLLHLSLPAPIVNSVA